MDLATFLGLLVSFGLIGSAMITGPGGVMTFLDIPSALIVFGGTIGATLTQSPLGNALATVGVLKNAFFASPINMNMAIDQFVDYANRARREGILALEPTVSSLDDPYLKKGLQLTVDGMEPQTIAEVLELEMSTLESRHEPGVSVVESMASYAPALGLIGTVVGLVQMLKSMDDPTTIGPAMALALITTFYGVVLANLIFLPLANKLKTRSKEEILLRELQLEGILGIAKGDNPRIMQEKLTSFQAPTDRRSR